MAAYEHEVTATFDRPADTTAYASGDAIADGTSAALVMTFTQCVPENGRGAKITGALLFKDDASVTNCDIDLVLFNASPTAFEDNAAYDPSDAEIQTIRGVISFVNGDAVVGANNAMWHKTNLDIVVKAAAGTQTLYGALVARGAYTPASAETFTVTLQIEFPR